MKQFRHRLFHLSRIAFSRILYGPDKAKLVVLWLLMCLARFQNTQEKPTCMNKEAKSCIYHALEWQWSRVKKWPFAVLSIISLSRPVSHLITQVTSAQTGGHYGGALGWPPSWKHEKTYFCSYICLIKKQNNGMIVFVIMDEFHNALHFTSVTSSPECKHSECGTVKIVLLIVIIIMSCTKKWKNILLPWRAVYMITPWLFWCLFHHQ